jgi:hypothetical protein
MQQHHGLHEEQNNNFQKPPSHSKLQVNGNGQKINTAKKSTSGAARGGGENRDKYLFRYLMQFNEELLSCRG